MIQYSRDLRLAGKPQRIGYPYSRVSRFASLQRRRQGFRERFIGAIEPQRRDRYVARRKRREIGAFGRRIHHRGALEADPEIRIAATIVALVDFQEAEIALALPRHANALDKRHDGRGNPYFWI